MHKDGHSSDFGRLNKCRRCSNGNGNPIWKGAAIKRIFIEFTSCPSLLPSSLSPLRSPLLCTDRVGKLLHYTHFGGSALGEAGRREGESPKRSEQAVTLCKVNRFPLLSSPFPLHVRQPHPLFKQARLGTRKRRAPAKTLLFVFIPSSRGGDIRLFLLLSLATATPKPVRPPR